MEVLGIDIGGSGMKAGIVDTRRGKLVSERIRVPTPHPTTPKALLEVVRELVEAHDWQGPAGCGFPGVVRSDTVRTAFNLHESLVGLPLAERVSEICRGRAVVLNDADAAGVAEIHHGAGVGCQGTVLMLTIGTGIGSVLFRDGMLVPNTEFGHVQFRGQAAETLVSDRAREEEELSWKRWARRFNEYLEYMTLLVQPDVIILGGGGAKKPEKFAEYLEPSAELRFATFGNKAGIIGAAMAAAARLTAPPPTALARH